MLFKILIGVGVLFALFLVFVATRPGQFRYERSGLIETSPDKIFPYLRSFKMGEKWSPYEKDATMKKTINGVDGEVGSSMEFDSKNSGTGRLEILKITPNEHVQMRLSMIKPFKGENIVEYRLTPEGTGTRFTWTMEGDGGFFGKLIAVFIDCEKMVGDQFSQGIASLKALVEASNDRSSNEG